MYINHKISVICKILIFAVNLHQLGNKESDLASFLSIIALILKSD